MKKILITLILLSNIIFAKDISSELFEQIFHGIFPKKSNIYIYNIGNNKYKFKNIIYTKEIYNSDLIFISEYYRLEIFSNKPIFVSSLEQLKIYENSIGALYWENDEAKIIFLKDRLKKYNIEVAEYLKKYLYDEKIYSF